MSWKKRIGIGCGGLVALLVLAAAALWIWKPWVPKVEVVEPGVGGKRVMVGTNPANYYAPSAGQTWPGVLVIGGSEGGLGKAAGRTAVELHKQGFAVLQLSYFRAPGQPEDLARIPVETFFAGLDWLKAQPGVDAERIAIEGASKGAEAALLVATMRPDVKAVVAAMPSSVVWPGFSWAGTPPGGSSWTLGGKDVPALPYGEFSYSEGIGSVYVNGLRAAAQHPEAAIKIEQSKSAVLLICGEADNLWPSCPMARQLVQRDPRVTLLAYPDAGHAVYGLPRADNDAKGMSQLGGTDAGNNAARKDSWPKLLEFLKANLNAPTADQGEGVNTALSQPSR